MKNWELVLVFVGGIFWNVATDFMATFTKLPWWANSLVLALIAFVVIVLTLTIVSLIKRRK